MSACESLLHLFPLTESYTLKMITITSFPLQELTRIFSSSSTWMANSETASLYRIPSSHTHLTPSRGSQSPILNYSIILSSTFSSISQSVACYGRCIWNFILALALSPCPYKKHGWRPQGIKLYVDKSALMWLRRQGRERQSIKQLSESLVSR